MKNHRIHPKVLASLHERKVTVAWLAGAVESSRAHVNQVLANAPGRGYRTRAKLIQWLTAEERMLLNWGLDGRLFHEESSKSKPFSTRQQVPASASTCQQLPALDSDCQQASETR